MARKKQLEFQLKGLEKPGLSFGGSALKSHPKTKRPLSSKLPIHLTLRAHKSVMRLPKNYGRIGAIIESAAQRHGVRIYRWVNVGNHLHFAMKIPHPRRWAGFIRELTGRIALALRTKGFWIGRPHTRVIAGWRKAFGILKEYLELNWLEAQGFINRRETKTLKDLRAIFDG